MIFPLVSIYPRVKIGADTVLHSNAAIREDVRIGSRVILHNGVVIGADGFGYLKAEDGGHLKIPQNGTVVIEDDVEIGANTTVDRAALGETVIRKGTKIDNLVMVAHNVEVGENAILVAQTGIAGSSKVGRNIDPERPGRDPRPRRRRRQRHHRRENRRDGQHPVRGRSSPEARTSISASGGNSGRWRRSSTTSSRISSA